MSTQPAAAPDFIPDDEMPDFISDEEMTAQSPSDWTASAHTAPDPGPVSRFLAPIGDAIRSLPDAVGLAAEVGKFPATALTNPRKALGLVKAAGQAIGGPMVEQAERAGAAFDQGRYSEAAGHGLAAALPVVGPMAAEMGETLGEGNVAGALGQAAANFAPIAPGAAKATTIAKLLKKRAAARILDIWRPSPNRMETAKEIAFEVAGGVPGRGAAGGIGVGNLDELTAEASKRGKAATQDVRALKALSDPVDTGGISRELRSRGEDLVTRPPARKVWEEVPTGILDEAGDPIMGMAEKTVKGKPSSEHPDLVRAYRRQAKNIEERSAQYPDEKLPAGEFFKQRAALGGKFGKAYQKLPGDMPPAAATAGRDAHSLMSDLAHDERVWGEGGLGGSKLIDRDNRVWRNAAINFKRAGLRDNRSLQGLKQLLVGRLTGAALGFGAGIGFGPIAGVGGALGGVLLGESVRWGSFRAHHYAKISKLLNDGRLDEAAELVQRINLGIAADEARRERERHRKAQDALRGQAEGVVAP